MAKDKATKRREQEEEASEIPHRKRQRSTNDDDDNDDDKNEEADDNDEEADDDDDDDDNDDNEDEEEDKEEKGAKKSSLSEDPLPFAPDVSFGPSMAKSKVKPIIILLDQASLETWKNRRGIFELLNCDDHRELCRRKLKKDPNIYRPDILHQELLALMDSPLNKAGLLKVYIQTTKRVLIDVNPSTRIPRTFKRFSGLMIQLLHKLKIKAGTESTVLLKVIKNPFSQYLPAGTKCYGFSCQGTLYSPIRIAPTILPDTPEGGTAPTCFVIGAMSTGHVTINDHPYIQEMISLSSYPLSGAAAIARLLGGVEHHWGIV